MGNRNHARTGDGVQIMVGEYSLTQGSTTVGKLYVENVSGPSHTKEHWLLYSSYRWPSSTNTRQDLHFEYRGTPGDLREFLLERPAGTTYIIAECVQQTLP